MNKKVLAVVVVLLLLAAGYFLMNKSGSNGGSLVTGTQTQPGKLSFTSIQDALSRSLSLECTFTDDNGRQTKTYMKAGAVRTDFTGSKAEESGSMILKDKKMYSWNDTTKQGFMMQVPDLKITPTQNSKTGAGKGTNPADALAMIEKYKSSCKPGTVADSLFTPPAEIKFTDYSNMMKDLQKVAQPTNGAMNEESLKQLMEKYGAER
ncbi:MAG: hypothetical protein WAT72_01870 [Microgenomates group bacterium]|jgi:hypothetical protein|nr:hypothetical protein [Candidatus Woesebacteria bacterium]MBP6883312.1 hypothetical protein [Candidatus Woesebacteria bacterium]